MAQPVASPQAQRGAALLAFVAMIVMGSAWFAISALSKAAPTTADREIRTAQALRAGKDALLSYAAQYAARTDHNKPGRLPCPEPLNAIGTSTEGQAAASCSNTSRVVGRLPWRTLGIERPVDGAGEPLWYVLSPNFRGVSPTTPINFGTPGELALDGTANAAVALIIAPGAALNTQADPDTPPPGCSKRNQLGARFSSPLDALDFLECGNATGNYVTVGDSKWHNDRVIAVSPAEWADAIAGPVADRIQRQVAPALRNWQDNEPLERRWGVDFMPYALPFSTNDPASSALCGDAQNYAWEGLPPTAPAGAECQTRWAEATPSSMVGLTSSWICTPLDSGMICSFTTDWNSGIERRVTINASTATSGTTRVPSAYRSKIIQDEISATHGGIVENFVHPDFDPATGVATVSFQVRIPPPPGNPSAPGTFTPVSVTIGNLPTAQVLTAPDVAWFFENQWPRFSYYAVSPAMLAQPGGATCTAPGDPDCIKVDGFDPRHGNWDDKRLVIVLMGRRLSGSPIACTNKDECLEQDPDVSTTLLFKAGPVSSTFNDRIAACPFQLTPATGSPVTLCD